MKRGKVDPIPSALPRAHDNDRRRPVFPRAHQSSPSNNDEPTGLEARVCLGRPKNNKDKVRGKMDILAM